jgi:hypothetical protein
MHAQISPNEYLVTELTVRENTPGSHIVRLDITEKSEGAHSSQASFVMVKSMWQQVADQLAELGIVAQSAEVAR